VTTNVNNLQKIDFIHYYNFFTNLVLNNNLESPDYEIELPDKENYSFLMVLLMMWVKINEQYLFLELEELTKIKVVVKKSVGRIELQKLSKMFSELTLDKLNFIETADDWYAIITF